MVVITPSMDRVFHNNSKVKQGLTEIMQIAKACNQRNAKKNTFEVLTHGSLTELSTGRHHTLYISKMRSAPTISNHFSVNAYKESSKALSQRNKICKTRLQTIIIVFTF